MTNKKGSAARAAVLVLLVLTPIGCKKGALVDGKSVAEKSPAGSAPAVALIAIDGLEPSLLDRFVASGRLPNLGRLIERGQLAHLESDLVLKSPVIWTTVATGVEPQRHGIVDFTQDGVPVTSSLRRSPALWNFLSHYGVPAATIAWMVTWPAEADSGIVISDRAHWGNFERKAEPSDAIDLERYQLLDYRQSLDFLVDFTSYPYGTTFEGVDGTDPSKTVEFLVEQRLIMAYLRDRIVFDLTFDFLDDAASHGSVPEVVSLYFQGIDFVSHGFWKYFDPLPFREQGLEVAQDDVERLGSIIPAYYEFIDAELGKLVARFDDHTNIILLSDHGFGPALGEHAYESNSRLSGNHRKKAVLLVAGPAFVSGSTSGAPVSHYDILPTVLHLLGVPVPQDLVGEPLLSLIHDDFVPTHDEAALANRGALDWACPAPCQNTPSAQDETIKSDLRSLGYIE